MTDFRYDDVRDSSADTGNGLANLARAGRTALCNLYTNTPQWLLPDVLGDPGGIMARAFYDNICRPDFPAPTLPTPAFSGGQCPVQYNVSYTITAFFPPNPPGSFSTSGTVSVFGTIKGTKVEQVGAQWNVYLVAGANGNPGASVQTSLLSIATTYNSPVVTITSISRVDGQPDNCGDPTPTDDRIPPINQIEYNTDIEVGGVDITVPIVVIRPTFDVDVNFRPEVVVNVGGIDVNFQLDGITFNIQPGDNFPPTVPPLPDPRPNPPTRPPGSGGGGGGGDCPDVDLTPVLDRLTTIDGVLEVIDENVIELLDCDRCERLPITSSEYTSSVLGTGNSGDFSLNADAEWVELNLIDIPENARIQYGMLAPDVRYSGWYAFRTGDGTLQRHPVHYENNAIPVPKGITKFSYTLYTGHTALAIQYIRNT